VSRFSGKIDEFWQKKIERAQQTGRKSPFLTTFVLLAKDCFAAGRKKLIRARATLELVLPRIARQLA
jgi:hypothetical protein